MEEIDLEFGCILDVLIEAKLLVTIMLQKTTQKTSKMVWTAFRYNPEILLIQT